MDDKLYLYREVNAHRIEYVVVRIETIYDSKAAKISKVDDPCHPGYLIPADTLIPMTESQLERYTMLKLSGADTSACIQA